MYKNKIITEATTKSKIMQGVDNVIWTWLRKNLHRIESYNLQPRLTSSTFHSLRVGDGDSQLHPDFWSYLNTPEPIKRISEALAALLSIDSDLAQYIYYRGKGFTAYEIDRMEVLSGPLSKPRPNKKRGKTGRVPTERGRNIVGRARSFLVDVLPEEVYKNVASQAELYNDFGLLRFDVYVGRSTRREKANFGDERVHGMKPRLWHKLSDHDRELINCPACGGDGCNVCENGQMIRRIAEAYARAKLEGRPWNG